jgi:adenylate cyclase
LSDNIHQVEFLGEKLVPISEGETILHASLKAGIPHYHACGGNAKCSTCRVLILGGMENLSEINEKERALRKRILLPKNVRLACQTYITGEPVLLKRIIRDRTDVHLYVHKIDEEETQKIGEEKELALFFLDIRNFTPLMETSLPFDVIHIISRLYLLFEKVIKSFKGEIIETAGDGLYAVFGFDTTLQDAATNAFHAATNVFKELRNFNKDYLAPYFSHSVEVGIGIHAGKVIMGSIEINKTNQLKVMGLPVNIASRLQSATRELNNNFIVSAYCYSYWSYYCIR